jgi:hypothetical protein
MRNPTRSLALLGLCSAALLTACGPKPADTPAGNTTTPPEGTVTREEVKPEAPPPAPITQPVIQTQPGPHGSTVTLNKATVTGDVLTIQLTYGPVQGFHSQYLKLDEVSLVDDATAQRISVLKDNADNWLAAPLASGGKALNVVLGDTPAIVWFKFPAPPATSKTVSLNLPEAAPFDGIPVTR